MYEQFDLIMNAKAKERREDISAFRVAEAEKARAFHSSFSIYRETPLVSLQHLADELQVKRIYLKDESKRFGLNAFKVLGASYAIANEIGKKLERKRQNFLLKKFFQRKRKKSLVRLPL